MGVKLQRNKKLFFGEFCFTSRIFLVSVLLFALVKSCFVSLMPDFKTGVLVKGEGEEVESSKFFKIYNVFLGAKLFPPTTTDIVLIYVTYFVGDWGLGKK